MGRLIAPVQPCFGHLGGLLTPTENLTHRYFINQNAAKYCFDAFFGVSVISGNKKIQKSVEKSVFFMFRDMSEKAFVFPCQLSSKIVK